MPEHERKIIGIIGGFAKDSLTTSHIERSLTTAHLQQQLQQPTQQAQASPKPSTEPSSTVPTAPSGK
jgi:hypothetical protein